MGKMQISSLNTFIGGRDCEMLVVATKESTTIVRVIQRGTMSFNRANLHPNRKERACLGISAVEISQSGPFNALLAPVPPGVKRSPLGQVVAPVGSEFFVAMILTSWSRDTVAYSQIRSEG
jgi:hypothetical protein